MTPPATKSIWVGVLCGDEVRAQRCVVTRAESDSLHGKCGLPHGLKWRFVSGCVEVFWWEPPSGMESAIVHAWLEGKGEHPTRDIWTRWNDFDRVNSLAVSKRTAAVFRPWAETVLIHH